MIDETEAILAGSGNPVPGDGDGDAVDGAQLEALLKYLKRSRGFDFTGYKRSSLGRRVRKRLRHLGLDRFAAYTDYLEANPQEFRQLFNTILINVTGFFRDQAAWDYLAGSTIPRLIGRLEPDRGLRIWCPGSASGEEAYSVAMLLAEALGDVAFCKRVKIYATDIDEEALAKARGASYDDRDVAGVPPAMLAKYFEHGNSRYMVRKDLCRAVVFGRQDLVQDAPIPRIDLLICRNTLMYFTAETQDRVLSRLHFALDDAGFLFLGRAEMLFTHRSLFAPADLRARVFSKVTKSTSGERLLTAHNHAAGNGTTRAK